MSKITIGHMKEIAQKFVTDPRYRFLCLDYYGFYNGLSDEKYLKKLVKSLLNYNLDLEKPKRFNEKIQWLKMNDRNPLYTQMVDKYLVKEWVAKVIGEEYIIPTLGVWDKAEDIDFNKLPNQFVLKCNHNSGEGMLICKDKSLIDINSTRSSIKKALKKNYYYSGREWPYKNVCRKVIAEKYMDDGSGQLKDYKLFVFEGKVQYIQVDYDRFSNHRRNFYDRNWNYVPFTTCYETDPNYIIEKPACLDELIEKAEIIAKELGTPHFVRIDFYIINNKIYFGEITFYHGSGIEKFYPDEWDYKLGDLIKISE